MTPYQPANDNELRVLLRILPRGEPDKRADCMFTNEILDVLDSQGVHMTERRLQEVVHHLRTKEHVPIGSYPNKGYWLPKTREEAKRVYNYIFGLGIRHLETAEAIKQGFNNQPGQGGFQLTFEGNGNGFKDIDACGLTEEQAQEANEIYWNEPYPEFKKVADQLGLHKSQILKFWDNLDLHSRKRGGWGKEDVEIKHRENRRRIKYYFTWLKHRGGNDGA